MKGIIEAISEEKLTSKNKPFLILQIDGQDYSLWDKKVFAELRVGMGVLFEAKQSGDYFNIATIEPLNANGGGEKPLPGLSSSSDFDIDPVRLLALDKAMDLHRFQHGEFPTTSEDLIDAAIRIEAFLLKKTSEPIKKKKAEK